MPISSTVHHIIVPWLFRWSDPGLSFDIALHMGTLVALLWFFLSDLLRLARAGIASIVERKIGNDTDRRLAWLIVIGTIPDVIAGLLCESKIEELLHQPDKPHTLGAMVAMAIIITLLGAALFVAERIARHLRGLYQVSLKDAMIIGLSQTLAIFPGVSHSGSTITAGLAVGLRRETTARFSFLLSAPIVLGAGLKSVLNVQSELATGTMVHYENSVVTKGFGKRLPVSLANAMI